MKGIVKNVASQMALNRNNIREFLDEAFNEISEHYDLCRDFQARSAKFGETFEACFEVIINKLYPNLEFEFTPNVALPKACMVDGGEADFAVFCGQLEKRKLVAVIETKGAADKITCNGKEEKLTRPGMLRTDTVKKAICNAYQVKRAYPNTLFFIVTSHKPTSGNAKCMCDLAEGDIVDKIVDVTNPKDLDEMIEKIKSILKIL
jgi:hypothetical protein